MPADPLEALPPAPLIGLNLDESATPFFAVSLFKLAVMSLCTFGVYEMYWFYRNWQAIRQREALELTRSWNSISPLWRTIFSVFYCYSCFARIDRYGAKAGVKSIVPPAVCAAGWIILQFLVVFPSEPWELASLLAVVFLLPVQSQVNRINETVAGLPHANSRLSAWNWVAVVLGGLVLVLAVLGLAVSK